MEGDVLGSLFRWYVVLAIGAALILFIAMLLGGLAKRLLQQVSSMDRDLQALVADLPLRYQRRDDAIRELEVVDKRYQDAIEKYIDGLRREVRSSTRRIEVLEQQREEDVRTYFLRDDAIREYTAMTAKMDKIYEAVIGRRHDR